MTTQLSNRYKNNPNKIKKRIAFTIAAKWLKYLRLNLTQEVQDMYI
jgi:hypothetical protein